jgi:hypothetical protein
MNEQAKIYCETNDEIVTPVIIDGKPVCPECSGITCIGKRHRTVRAENERCLSLRLPMHRGALHGIDSYGIADIEFPSVRHAASFVETLRASDLVRFRDPVTRFNVPVVIQIQIFSGLLIFPTAREMLSK